MPRHTTQEKARYLMRTFTVTVLEKVHPGEMPTTLDGDEADCFGLEAINYAITNGECVGAVQEEPSQELTPEQMHEALIAAGNDGTFFDSDDAE